MNLTLNAQTLRIALASAMFILVAGGVAGFIFAQQKLQEFASTITQLESEAAANDASVESLQKLQSSIGEYNDVKELANSITVDSADYPAGVIDTVTRLARESGITFKNVSFVSESKEGTSTEGEATTPLQEGTPPQTAAPTPAPATPAGLTKRLISVVPPTSLNFDQFVVFIEKLESDPMHLQVNKLSIAKESGNQVSIQPFEIEVYVK